jgi:ABC-type lipoprotein export system ATPase subunit
MKIVLSDIMPFTLKDKVSSSELWETRHIFLPRTHILLHAPSARGKTTIISMIYGLRSDYCGDILFDDRKSSHLSSSDWAVVRQKHLSIVFQDMRLLTGFSGLENILIKANLTRSVTEKTILKMAERLGIEHILGKQITGLSLGECQRIALLRALVQPFDWLLLDEPFSHLDRRNREKAAGLITEECEKRKAGIIMTDLDEEEYFAYDAKVRV